MIPGNPNRGGARVVYWLLVLMGLATFAPCVLLPQWRQYETLCMAEQLAEHRLEVLQGRIEAERRTLEALRSDPAVVARFAQRDLGFRRPFEQVIRVAASASPAATPAIPVPHRCSVTQFEPDRYGVSPCGWRVQRPQPPALIARALSYLPNYDYDAIFCKDDTRPIVMGLSLSLIGVAFVLFSRHRVTTK